MSLVYTPINGNAGQATFSLVDRETGEVFSTATVYVADFDEEDEESEFNELFTNIIDDLVKDYHGFRKHIYLSLVNAASIDRYSGNTNNLPNILSILGMINNRLLEPSVYRLQIQYRDSATMQDAVYIGNFKLQEAVKNASIGQIVSLHFAEKSAHNLDYSVPDYLDRLCLEAEGDSDGGHILLEDGNELLAETYTIPA